MNRWILTAVLLSGLAVWPACIGTKSTTPQAAAPTAPPAQSPASGQGTRAASPSPAIRSGTPAFGRAAIPSAAVTDITEQVRFKPGDLPAGYTFGQFQSYQSNESAVNGYDDEQAVLARMNSTGRLGGLLQQIITPNSAGGAGVTVDVWRDEAGAKAFFDQFPRPEQSIKYEEISLPKSLGDQYFAFKANVGGQVDYSVTWRRGRIILGTGELYPAGHDSLDNLTTLIDLLDKKAQAAKQ